MALTLTVTTPLTDDDRRVLGALLGGTTILTAEENFRDVYPNETRAPAAATAPDPASETEPDAGAPESGEGLDADGLPWDEAIHSSNKKKTAAGVWMRRRGVQDAVFDARVAELRAEMSGDTETAEDVFNQQVDATAQTVAPPPPPAAATEAEVPPPPAPAPAAPAAPAAEGNEWEGQPGFLKIMKLVTAKKLPAERLNGLLESVGLAPTTTSLLKADADTRAAFAALLEGDE